LSNNFAVSSNILEVIACSVAEAIAAERGGASRLEIVRDLDRGGLTPSVELVRAIKHTVNLPLRVMVRESDGYETSSQAEVDRLCAAAECFAVLGVDGLVLGFLKHGGIDLDLTRRVLASAPSLKATFHHAFEDAADQLHAISELKQLVQVDRILSHGGTGTLEERTRRLDAFARTAAPEITIIAGGGIDYGAIELLRRTTTIREFHVGRAAREGFQVEGAVQAELVRRLVQLTLDK
jgi:copper homeostasis protein